MYIGMVVMVIVAGRAYQQYLLTDKLLHEPLLESVIIPESTCTSTGDSDHIFRFRHFSAAAVSSQSGASDYFLYDEEDSGEGQTQVRRATDVPLSEKDCSPATRLSSIPLNSPALQQQKLRLEFPG